MKEEVVEFRYKHYNNIEELPGDLKELLRKAQDVTSNAHAPYSQFYVGAAAKLVNGQIITGTNQENASFPIGLCAERVLLATASSIHPKVAIDTIAISYKSDNQESNRPISPCGICRQSLQEFEMSHNHPMQLVLGGVAGPVYVIENAKQLLPLAFTSDELK